MSFLNRLLKKNKNSNPADTTAAGNLSVTPSAAAPEPQEKAPEPVEISRISYSPQTLLRELYRNEANHPEDLQLVRSFLPSVQIKCRLRSQAYENYEKWKATADIICRRHETGDTPAEIPPSPDSADSCAEVMLSHDNMAAYLYLLPPVGDGKDITPETIDAAVQSAGITTGIDTEALSRISAQKIFYCLFPIARGTAATDGTDGRIEDHYSRVHEVRLLEDSRGNVDHRNLNIFQNIKAGEIICDIIPPCDGVNGINVLGSSVPSKKGAAAVIPQGKGTAVSKDGAALVALIDGDISFINGVFRVESKLTVSHDVDNSVGNLDFAGDILITGDVCRGFSVKAGGNITIYGMVESSTITAGENIDIKKGMNGGGAGFLKAGGNVHSRFLEHANVWAQGDIHAETIVNSQITCGGSVYALNGRGVIIGGVICAAQSVEARKIGTASNTENIIKIGSSILNEENVDYISAELTAAKKTLDMVTKNHRYLTSLSSIPANKQEVFKSLTEQKQLYETRVKELSQQLEELLHTKPDYSQCHIKSDIIYGITEIELGYGKLTIKNTSSRCNVYYKDGEIILGTY